MAVSADGHQSRSIIANQESVRTEKSTSHGPTAKGHSSAAIPGIKEISCTSAGTDKGRLDEKSKASLTTRRERRIEDRDYGLWHRKRIPRLPGKSWSKSTESNRIDSEEEQKIINRSCPRKILPRSASGPAQSSRFSGRCCQSVQPAHERYYHRMLGLLHLT